MRATSLSLTLGGSVLPEMTSQKTEIGCRAGTGPAKTFKLISLIFYPGSPKKAAPWTAIVSTSKARSRKRLRASQAVSAISKQPWQAAPWRARSLAVEVGS